MMDKQKYINYTEFLFRFMNETKSSKEIKFYVDSYFKRLETKKSEPRNQCWITKDKNNKRISNTELESYLKDGWVKGRKMK